MKLKRHTVALFSCLVTLLACAQPALVPWPTSIQMPEGPSFRLEAKTRIVYQTRAVARQIENSLEPLAHVLAGEIELITGFRPKVEAMSPGAPPGAGNIALQFAPLLGVFAPTEAEEDQAYALNVASDGVRISSAYFKGVAYGTATLLQALREEDGRFTVPGMKVADQPVAAFRAVMIDVARNVHSPGVIQDVIRLARGYKLRYVHLHLTDDQNFTFPFAPVTGGLTNNFTYSRQELTELVAYADARGVTLIPELDLPGHSTKVKLSNYLSPGQTDADVAAPENFAKIHAIIDDMLGVFASSPYFHIGGDESGAGEKLIPFIASVNQHLRAKPASAKRRLLVWEGFHGAPTNAIPAAGEDQVLVVAWESAYNPPWSLLAAGYTLVNASWKPTYVVGGGSRIHSGSTWGRSFTLEDIYRWDKNTFMHWEPGRPVYEDQGPNDSNRHDSEWNAHWIHKADQIIGGQLVVWEQKEKTVINSIKSRLPVVAERLWNPQPDLSFASFAARAKAVNERVLTIVQPVEILPAEPPNPSAASGLYQPYAGDQLALRFRNRTRIPGVIHYVEGSFSGRLDWVFFPDTALPTASSLASTKPVPKTGGFSVCARLFRADRTPVEGTTWKFFNNWPDRVRVTDYDIGRNPAPVVADLSALPATKILRRYELPMLRGPIRNVDVCGQLIEGVLTPPGTGDYQISVKTQNGHATLYVDLNQNGRWDEGEAVIRNTPNTEVLQSAKIELRTDQPCRIRIDHNTGQPWPVLLVYLDGPGTNGRKEISPYLTLPTEQSDK